MRTDLDFNRAPLLLIWEVTRACALACRHCRASAEDIRHPSELSLDEGKRLLDGVKAMGTPLVIFTGGDPLQRDDLEELIRYAKSIGLRAGAIPAATPRLTRERVNSLQQAGLDQMAISLDGPNAKQHDDFRRVEGTFTRAMDGARWAREIGLPLQVNTVFGAWNINDFDAMASLVESLGIVFWEVFLLVPTGRGAELSGITPDQVEELFGKLYDLARRVNFIVKITEGQHFRRYVAQRSGGVTPRHGQAGHPSPRLMLGPHPVNAGRGFCFVDHVGGVFPSGFLTVECGNVRKQPVSDIYRNSPVFRQLRDASLLKGRCGRCEFRETCSGGSRARAFALTGDYLAEDPLCGYQPAPVPAAT
jgi:radical SAM protein